MIIFLLLLNTNVNLYIKSGIYKLGYECEPLVMYEHLIALVREFIFFSSSFVNYLFINLINKKF